MRGKPLRTIDSAKSNEHFRYIRSPLSLLQKGSYIIYRSPVSSTMKNRLTPLSQSLRKTMTKEERHLWYDFLKTLPVTVKRQEVFGRYIADFYISEARLIIELDGSQHYSEQGEEKDRIRDRFFQKLGIKVLRYTNIDIKNHFRGVCEDILKHIESERKTEA